MTTAVTTDLRARAREAHHRDVDESAARIAREAAEGGRMLATILFERLGVALETVPDRPSVDVEGIRFSAHYDADRGYRDTWRAWVLRAAVLFPCDEYGERTSEWVRVESLADLGSLLAEYESPVEC